MSDTMSGEKIKLVPKLRFPEFRDVEGWHEKSLANFASVVMGSSPKSEFYNKNQIGLPLLQGNADIKNRLSDPRVFTSEITKECIYGDILLSVRAPVGSVAKSIHHACIGRGIAAIRANNQNAQEFLYQWLLYFETNWVNVSQGGTFDAVNSEDLRGTLLTVPNSVEQQKIADCLSSVDELIAAQARKVDALKTHRKGLMQQLFPREGEAQPRLRFPEFQNSGEWEVSQLGSVSDVRDGTHDSPSFFPTGRPLVTSKNLRPGGTLDLENVSLISEEDYEQISKRSKVSVGDILFGMIGTIGNPVLIKSEGFAIKNVALIKELGSLSNVFLVQLLQSGYVAAIFAVLNTGNSQKFIALGKIRGLPVPVPSLPEQQRIASCLSRLDDLITAETQKLETLKTHKKALMQQLFPSVEVAA